MVIIVKKLVPVYNPFDNVPKQYHNLRKTVFVTSFKFLYSTIPTILIKQYGLKSDEKIVVFWMKEVSLPHFNRYRTKFRKVYSGPLSAFGAYMKKVRKGKKPKDVTKTST